MSDQQAHVSSSDAIEAFRAALLVYLSKARPVVEDACDDVFRTREWLERDRHIFWENQLKLRRRKLEEAEQAVFSARLSNLREVTTAEQAAVHRAKRAFVEAEEKLRLIKKWMREFDHRVQPLVKELEQVRTVLSNHMPKAAAYLAQVINAINAYAGVAPTQVAAQSVGSSAESSDSDASSEQQQ